jgi:hypothetical protein
VHRAPIDALPEQGGRGLGFQGPGGREDGPIAWQMHNAGLFDEYKDVTIQTDPNIDELVSVK